jgi:hypothetical protein
MAHPILEAQAGLKELLQADPAFASVEVQDGGPTEGEDIAPAAFWFERVDIPLDGWASIGAQRRRITFNLGFTVAVRTYGDDEQSTRQAALDLFEALMVLIKANPTLNRPAAIRQVDDFSGAFNSLPVSPQEWGAFVTGSLVVTSRDY